MHRKYKYLQKFASVTYRNNLHLEFINQRNILRRGVSRNKDHKYIMWFTVYNWWTVMARFLIMSKFEFWKMYYHNMVVECLLYLNEKDFYMNFIDYSDANYHFGCAYDSLTLHKVVSYSVPSIHFLFSSSVSKEKLLWSLDYVVTVVVVQKL